MLVRSIQLLFICVLYLHFVQAHTDIFHSFEKRQTKYCGKNLVAALQLICNGVYNPMFKKSSYYDEIIKDQMTDDVGDSKEIQYPEKHRYNVMALLPGTFRRRARGVYDECCQKSCSVRELAAYCGER